MRIAHRVLSGAVLAFVAASVTACEASQGSSSPSPSPSPSYLHPVHDVILNESSCDSDGVPYVTIRIDNNSPHSMDYDVKYDQIDASGKVVGSAEGEFKIVANDVLVDQRLFDTTGGCGKRTTLAFVNAYVIDSEHGQPTVGD